jgi:hypothetical protein
MTLGNMRERSVRGLAVYCLSQKSRRRGSKSESVENEPLAGWRVGSGRNRGLSRFSWTFPSRVSAAAAVFA